jgi:hypothetical protein
MTPRDLQQERKVPKNLYGAYMEAAWVPVRVRLAGAWRLGVLRAWLYGAGVGGWLVRIETADERDPDSVRSDWYRFAAESLDPLEIHTGTGEVRLMPPDRRAGPHGPRRRQRDEARQDETRARR